MLDFACKRIKLDEIIKCSLSLTRAEMTIFKHFMDNTEESFCANTISEKLEFDLSTIQRSLKKLHEKDILFRTQENLSGGGYLFHYQIKNKQAVRKLIMDIVHMWTKKVDEALKNW